MREIYPRLFLTIIIIAVIGITGYSYWLLTPKKEDIEAQRKKVLIVPANIIQEVKAPAGFKMNGQFPIKFPGLGRSNPFASF